MAEESLVIKELNRDMIDAGNAFVSKLESEGFDATAILWLYMEHLGEWRVVIAAPDVDILGAKSVYLKARSILYGMSDDAVKAWLINKVMTIDERRAPIPGLQKEAARLSETKLGALKGIVDGSYIDSYIYKITPLEPTTVKLALLSAYDKTGLVDFARQLKAGGYDLVSTGGTARDIKNDGIDVQEVSDLTGSPEILDGRVKTLHPTVHAGILARRDNESHMAQLADDETGTIDIVACNLYPFVETVSKPDVTLGDALENIDIGGPTMIRAAAKNFQDVLVVVDPADYEWIGQRIAKGGGITREERKELARKAFQHVALYDTAISRYLSGEETQTSWDEFTLGFNRVQDLRYGENPHQQATLYSTALSAGGIVDAKRLHGLEMSFTNILDADAAWRVVSDFSENAVAVIKHTNPCGLSVHPDQAIAYQQAFEGDSVSAYGGIVGFNRTVTIATAEAMRGVLYDQIIAPGFEPEALEILKRRRRTRILEITLANGPTEGLDVRTVSGGVLVQTADTLEEDPRTWNVATERPPTDKEYRDLAFAWRACKHIKSNTIVLAKDNTLVGMGAGQPNRVVSVHLSLRIAGDKAKGSVLASDAYFPFGDSVEMAAEGGITAIAQPGGSIRDEDSIEAANRLGIAMVLTGTRHFRH